MARPGTLDGSVWSQGGREWVMHEDQDDDGRWFGWSECGTCEATALGGDDARSDHECPDTICPRCDGEGRISWNLTSPRDPQHDEDAECPLCRENCVVTLTAAEQFLDAAVHLEDGYGTQSVDGWCARDYDPPRVPSATAPCASDGVPW